MTARSRARLPRNALRAGLALAILLLALGLRLYRLDAQSLWNDEGTSVALARRDAATIARDAGRDIHPPLYYWLLGGWVRLFGTGEAAVRSLSALLGGALVALTYALGRRLGGEWVALAASACAAISPFQVAYSQEARMYMLAAALAAGAVLALVRIVAGASLGGWLALVLLEAAGLYTHYSFAFVVLVVNLGYALWLGLGRDSFRDSRGRRSSPGRAAGLWLLSQGAVLALYAPWLPTALRQLTGWPGPEGGMAVPAALVEVWRWLVLGPTFETVRAAVPLLAAGALAAAGVVVLGRGQSGHSARQRPEEAEQGADTHIEAARRLWAAVVLVLWIAVPVVLIVTLGLYREAYLKFLLVASPAVCLLAGAGAVGAWRWVRRSREGRETAKGTVPLAWRVAPDACRVACMLVLAAAMAIALHDYYADPAYARDDYRSMAAYIAAVGSSGDAIVLNAPGQQEVFGYYYDGPLPVYPLPEDRPPDPAATEAALAELAQPGGRVFAVLWATAESDPERLVEGWLDRHTYRALDVWYGNVRLAVYAVPARTSTAPDHLLSAVLQNPENGDRIALLGYSLLGDRLAAGEIAQVSLLWRAEAQPARRYTAFVHLLDGNTLVAGQHDSEPVGGSRPTTQWAPGETVVDNHGVPVHPATPPGEYRVEVGLYDAETGRRLLAASGESQVWLEPLTVEHPAMPAPAAALGMQRTAGATLGELTLLGYDAHKLGFAHQPDVPLRPGDLLEVRLYWRAEASPSRDWRLRLSLVGRDDGVVAFVSTDPVPGYATSRWQAGDVWRGHFSLAIPGGADPGRYRLSVELYEPGRAPAGTFQSDRFSVEP